MILYFILESERKYLEYEKKSIAIVILKIKSNRKDMEQKCMRKCDFSFNFKWRLKHKGPLLQAVSMPCARHMT